MAQINFPAQPALQNPVNTYSPTSTPFSSKNGVTYVYNNGVWASSTDASFVATSGDHMSGNLSLGSTDGLTNELYLRNSTGQIVSGQYNFNSDQVFGTSIVPGGITVQKNATAASNDKAISVYHGSYLKESFTVFVDGTVRAKNMEFSGDLTVGGDKIEFDSSDGSASFAGSVDCGGLDTLLYQTGVLLGTTAGSSSCTVYGDSQSSSPSFVVFDGQAAVSTRASINKDGSAKFEGDIKIGTDKITLDATTGAAEFAGDVQVGGDLVSQFGVEIRSLGLIKAARSGSNTVIAGYTTGNGTATSEIKADGSADFKGDIQVGGDPHGETGVALRTIGLVKAARSGATDGLWAGYTTGDPSATSQIFASGSAEFAGTVESTASNAYSFLTNGGGFYANGSNGNALYIKDGGTYPVGVWNDSNNGKLELGTSILSDFSITLDGTDGSAEFKGGITNPGGTGYISTEGVGGLYGYLFAEETNSGNTVALNYKAGGNQAAFVAADSGGNTLAQIDWAGAASFASGAVTINPSGSLNVNRQGTTNDVISGSLAGSVTSSIKANGDAIFSGTVSSNGNILTRASGDLDVGDRLEKADNALKALKTAAAASSDFADLKAAIATALADI